MDNQIIQDLKRWFHDYTRTFASPDHTRQQNIDLKVEHTRRVCKEIVAIGENLGLSSQELLLAEIMALFHDLGRFEQYAHYQTFLDSKSVNHAELGIKILQKHTILNKLDESARNVIIQSILHHNRAMLPTNKEGTWHFFAKLLRDADKLDIWRVVIDYYYQENKKQNNAIELNLPDTPGISEYVFLDLMEGKIVDIQHIKNLNDFKLLLIGWIFDINFLYTFHCIRQRRYLEKIRGILPQSEKMERIFSMVQAYLDEKMQEKMEPKQKEVDDCTVKIESTQHVA